MNAEAFTEALERAAAAVREQGVDVKLLERGGIGVFELDLSNSKLAGGIELEGLTGHGMRMLRHGSNPGARLELKFGNNLASTFFAPGQRVSGGFKTVSVKRAKGSARIGKVTLAVFQRGADLSEDLIIGTIGPVDLLGTTDANGDPATWIAVAEDTDPNGATPTGAFDGSGWELLRVLVKGGANFTTANIHFWHCLSSAGTIWFDCGLDGVFSVPDSPTTKGTYRTFMVPWGGRGRGYPGVYSLYEAGETQLEFIIQGLK